MFLGCLSFLAELCAISAAVLAIAAPSYRSLVRTFVCRLASLALFAFAKVIIWVPTCRLGLRVARIQDLMGQDYPFRYFYASEGIGVHTDQKRIKIVRASDLIEQQDIPSLLCRCL